MVSKKTQEIELRPDGWERFRAAVAAAAKNGPKHRPGKPKAEEKQAANVQEAVDWIYANAPPPDVVVYVSKPPSVSIRLSRKLRAFEGRSKTDT
jgi:hypothetical protein